MSKLTLTNFSKRTGSPFQNQTKEKNIIVHTETMEKTHYDKQKEKQNDLIQKVNKRTAEYQAHKPSSGVFTEVVTHGAFTTKSPVKENVQGEVRISPPKTLGNGQNSSKSLLGFPSSANDLALDAKSDLESDPNISNEVKEKVIKKLFTLVSMVQNVYESKVRVMSEFEKFKDIHMKNEIRKEREHSEQLYKLNMNFQNEVVQSIQRLKSELDMSRNVKKVLDECDSKRVERPNSLEFNITENNSEEKALKDENVQDAKSPQKETSSNITNNAVVDLDIIIQNYNDNNDSTSEE